MTDSHRGRKRQSAPADRVWERWGSDVAMKPQLGRLEPLRTNFLTFLSINLTVEAKKRRAPTLAPVSPPWPLPAPTSGDIRDLEIVLEASALHSTPSLHWFRQAFNYPRCRVPTMSCGLRLKDGRNLSGSCAASPARLAIACARSTARGSPTGPSPAPDQVWRQASETLRVLGQVTLLYTTGGYRKRSPTRTPIPGARVGAFPVSRKLPRGFVVKGGPTWRARSMKDGCRHSVPGRDGTRPQLHGSRHSGPGLEPPSGPDRLQCRRLPPDTNAWTPIRLFAISTGAAPAESCGPCGNSDRGPEHARPQYEVSADIPHTSRGKKHRENRSSFGSESKHRHWPSPALGRGRRSALLEKRFPPARAEAGRTQLTEAGQAFLPKAIEAMAAHDAMFDDALQIRDPREVSRIVASRLVELALAALRHDLSDDDQKDLSKLL